MKTKVSKVVSMILFSALVTAQVYAGSASTNPANTKTLFDNNQKPTVIAPKLTVDWQTIQKSGGGSSNIIQYIKFEIENKGPLTIEITNVRLLDRTYNGVYYSNSMSMYIAKPQKKNWTSRDLINTSPVIAQSKEKIKVEYEIFVGDKAWYMIWDPNVSGSGSITLSETKVSK